MPYGFHLCGLHLALAIITLNAVLSFITCLFLVETAEKYGPRRVKTFIDFGMACFGQTGYYAVAILFLLNQIMTSIGYIIFFLQQLSGILPEAASDQGLLFFLLTVILVPLVIIFCKIGSARYLQGVAMTTLVIALILLYSAAF